MTEYDVETLRHDLREGIVTVVFTKTDGSERVMNCTLSGSHIPPQPLAESSQGVSKTRAPNPAVMAVWDVDASGWRSFRLDSVKSFTVK